MKSGWRRDDLPGTAVPVLSQGKFIDARPIVEVGADGPGIIDGNGCYPVEGIDIQVCAVWSGDDLPGCAMRCRRRC